jgi:hypothetical protein
MIVECRAVTQRFGSRVAAVWLVMLAVAGCASVDPAPFEAFEAASGRVAKGSEAAFRLDEKWSKEGFVERFVSGGGSYRDLLLILDDPATAPDSQSGLFAFRDAARAMGALNRGFHDYATLLARLAGTDVLTQREADRLEADLNARVSGLATRFTTLGVRVPRELRSGSALFTVAAVEGFRLFLDSRRRSALRAALIDNQALVEGWCSVAREALDRVGDELRFEYRERSRGQAEGYAAAKTDAARRRRVGEILSRNEALLDALATLRALGASYASMPAAHANLEESLSRRDVSLADLERFTDRARELRILHERLHRELEP